MNLHIKKVAGTGIKPFIPDIARLRITVFREFPYLYDGNQAYEQEYLETYVKSTRSIAVLVLDGQQITGVSTGIPLSDETEEFQRPFVDQGISPSEIFYCGESLLLPEYRGKGIYKTFIREREEYARSLEQFNKICFCAVVRDDGHPLKPENYQSLDPVWKSFGYRKEPDLTTLYAWKDIDQPAENEKTMVFWIKDLL
jgi:GNAT superfamily N-acetyltransferase